MYAGRSDMPGIIRSGQVEQAVNGYVTPNEDHFKRGGLLDPQRRQHNVSGTGFQPRNMSLDNLNSRTPDPMSLDKAISQIRKEKRTQHKKMGIRDRIGCFTWTWFTMVTLDGLANATISTD